MSVINDLINIESDSLDFVRSRLCQWYGICAETEDTTEQEYITADGCYTLWMVVKQTERSDKLVIVNHVLLDGRACKGKTPVHFKIYSIIDSEMDRGFLLYSMRVRAAIYLTMPAESLTPQSLHPFQTELHLSQIKQ